MQVNTGKATSVLENHPVDEKDLTNSVQTIVGTLEVLHVDQDQERSFEEYYLVTADGKRYRVNPKPGVLPTMSGQRMRIEATRIKGESSASLSGSSVIASLDVKSAESETAPAMKVDGTQKTLVLLAYYQNTPLPIQTWNDVYNKYFNPETNCVQSYFAEVSYGRVSFSGILNSHAAEGKMGDIYGWYLIERDAFCGCGASTVQEVMQKANEVEGQGVIPFNQYDRVVVISPWTCASYGIAGMGTMGKLHVQTPSGPGFFSLACMSPGSGIDPPSNTPEHEVGHNVGADHARFLQCEQGSFDGNNCQALTYGDAYDVMGRSMYRGQFNAIHMEIAGWLGDEANPSSLQTISTSQSVELAPIEVHGEGIKALKIVRTPDDFLYVEYRQPLGVDTGLSAIPGTDVFDGVLIHLRDPPLAYRSTLIDATGYYGGSFPNVALMQNYLNPFTGQTFLEDPVSHIKFKVISTQRNMDNPENSRITVHVQYPQCGADADEDGYYSEPECIISGVECDDSNFFANAGETEVCDGIDNNCDDQIDEGAVCCLSSEVCDGIDNTCDGVIDEGCCVEGEPDCPPLQIPECTPPGMNIQSCQLGGCSGNQRQFCEGGYWTEFEECRAVVHEEICGNGIDEDCDGADLICPCSVDQDGDGFMGNEGCDPGQWDCDDTNPNINPWAPEVCNGLDDNCVGGIDNDLFLNCGTNAGACAYGMQVCSNGEWGSCEGGSGPTPELCGNYVDEDCDYFIDDECENPVNVSNCTDFDGGRNYFVRGV